MDPEDVEHAPSPPGGAIPDAVRAACADVAGRARFVRVVGEAVQARAGALAVVAEAPIWLGFQAWGDDREAIAARVVVGNAVNFGSGWHPVLRKRPDTSGARTVAAALDTTPLTAGTLAAFDQDAVAELLGQDLGGPAGELLDLFAAALREIGTYVADRHGGSFAALVDAADGSALRLVDILAALPGWRDVAAYDGRTVPFWKRAQITANDLHRALGCFPADVDRLTMFADNLIPHVLRLDGVLEVDDALVARIGRGELLTYGEPAEVELRACAVHAVERLADASGRPPRVIDDLLWTAGQEPRYKSVPRPRCRTTAY